MSLENKSKRYLVCFPSDADALDVALLKGIESVSEIVIVFSFLHLLRLLVVESHALFLFYLLFIHFKIFFHLVTHMLGQSLVLFMDLHHWHFLFFHFLFLFYFLFLFLFLLFFHFIFLLFFLLFLFQFCIFATSI